MPSCFFQIRKEDFLNYDIIFGMDRWNMEDLELRAPANSRAKLVPFGVYDPQRELEIRDPYCVSLLYKFNYFIIT